MRLRWFLGLVTAFVVLGASGCESGQSDPVAAETVAARPPASSTTHTARQVGFPPRMPWWSRGRLHVEEGVMPTTLRRIVARGGTTIIGRATQHGSHWMILRERGPVDLFATRSLGAHPMLSANGLYAAWTTSAVTHSYDGPTADTAFTITAYDVGRGRVAGSTVIESRTACCDGNGDIHVAGIDNDGTVIVARYADRAWAWRPGGNPAELTGAVRPGNLTSVDQWPGGVSWTTGSSSGEPAAFGRVSATGVVTPVGRVPQAQGGLWSPHGTSYAYSPIRKPTQTRPVVWHDGQRFLLQAPSGSRPLAWESEGRVLLVDAGDPDSGPIRLLRCFTVDRRCEQAGPVLHRAVLPDTFAF